MTPLVSVIIDTFNHERFIEDAIHSALAQDFPRSQMEISVVDDGSTDRTPEIVRQFEPQVKLLQKPNGGQASAINFGIQHAKGDIIAFLDGDDVWLPNKLSRVVAEFHRHPEAVLVYHKFCFWDSRDASEWDPSWPQVSGDIISDRRKLLLYCAAPTSSLAFRRRFLSRIAPVPETCSYMHDGYLIMTSIFLGPVFAIPECLTKNRIHGANLWFAREEAPDPKVLKSRMKVRSGAIESIQRWAHLNLPSAQLAQARLIVRRFRLIQLQDQLLLEPSSVRSFLYRVRHNLIYAPTMTRADLAYNWIYAFFTLIAGKHAHYLEGFRTRARRFCQRLRGRSAAAGQPGETAEHVS